ncbi:MAG: hypothetical protein ACRELY_14550 [Polyangiaceae bacterium]
MTYRDELEAEHARVDALEKRARELEEENAELRGKSGPPHLQPAPQRTAPNLHTLGRFIAAAFAAFVIAFLSWAIVPATTRISAPLLCPSNYNRSLVVLHVYGGVSDSTTKSDLWCVPPDAAACPTRVDGISVIFTMVGECALPLMLLVLVTRLRRRSAS